MSVKFYIICKYNEYFYDVIISWSQLVQTYSQIVHDAEKYLSTVTLTDLFVEL